MPFKALGLHPHLVQATKEMGYTEPTPKGKGPTWPDISKPDARGGGGGPQDKESRTLTWLRRLLGR